MINSRIRVLYITNIPSPYRVDFFEKLGRECDLTVIFERASATDRDESWKNFSNDSFKTIILNGKECKEDNAFSFKVLKYLKRKQYDIIVIGGYSTPTAMLAILYMNIRKIRFVLNADGGFVKKENKIRFFLKKYLIGSASFYLSTGKETDKYLVYYGGKVENVYHYPFSSICEIDILKEVVEETEKYRIRQELGMDNVKTVISVGQFIHRKGFDILIKAMQRIPNVQLIIIGGKVPDEYLKLIDQYQISNIRFYPFMEKEKLFNFYRAADVFVLATREDIWGLVVNEAMAHGLPVITTSKCIAGIELISDYENGIIVPVNNEEKLANAIKYLLYNDKKRLEMSENALHTSKKYSIEKMVDKHMKIFADIIKRNA